MMVDVNLKVRALEKLVDYTASGIGAVAGSMLAPWRARQDAKAKLIRAQADADSLRLIADAQADARRSLVSSNEEGFGVMEIGPVGIAQRIEFQEKKRQANIVSVVQDAAAELGDKEVPDHEPDWTARFFDCVQDVSAEDMRKLWAKILTGEVESPGRTSLRTLDILKNMTGEDARTFYDICDFVLGTNPPVVFYHGCQYFDKYDALNRGKLIRLGECGLVNYGGLGAHTFLLKERHLEVDREDIVLQFSPSRENVSKLSLTVATLTVAGVELYGISQSRVRSGYLESCAGYFHSWGYRLARADIIARSSDGRIQSLGEFVPVEPEPEQPGGATQ